MSKRIARTAKASCITCHADYWEEVQGSIHGKAGILCQDCHGGNPAAATKEGAHGSEALLRSSEAASPVNYRNIPKTCAKCHEGIYDRYRLSKHFEHLRVAAQEEQGPNCVTCHGSLNIKVLNVSTVRQTCQKCHNEDNGNYPEIPAQAESVLNNFLSIHRYYRFIALRSRPEDARAFFQFVDPAIKQLNAEWHTFDLKTIDSKTHDLVQFMKVRRNDLLQANKGKRR